MPWYRTSHCLRIHAVGRTRSVGRAAPDARRQTAPADATARAMARDDARARLARVALAVVVAVVAVVARRRDANANVNANARVAMVAPDALARRVDRARRSDASTWTRARAALRRRPRVWLAVLGECFDVSAGRRFYAGDGDYATCFAGRDASRAFATGDFSESGCVSDVSGLTDGELAAIRGWRDFMRDKYRAAGVLANGEFYDAETGAATALTLEIRARLERYDAGAAAREQRARMFPDCDSTSDGDFVDVRCREDDSGPRYPRNETTTDAEGRASSRCACYGDLGVSDARRAYPGCDLTSTRCRAPLGAGVG